MSTRVVAFTILVALVAASCGGSDGSDAESSPGATAQPSVVDAEAPETTALATAADESLGDDDDIAETAPQTTAAATTTDAGNPLSDDSNAMLFVQCGPDGGADLQVLNPDSGSWNAWYSGVPGVCNLNGSTTNSRLTHSERFLLSRWSGGFGSEGSFSVVDLETGRQFDLTAQAASSWATAQTSSGLDARERSLEIAGIDQTGDGRLFLAEGDTIFAQDVADFVRSGGHLSLQEVPGAGPCQLESTSQSPGGAICVWWGGGMGFYYWAPPDAADYDAVEIVNDLDDLEDGGWLDAATLIGGNGYGSAIEATTFAPDDSTTDIYTVSGDRRILPWVNGPSGRIFVVSKTLDGTATEIYELLGDQTTLKATVGGSLSPIHREHPTRGRQ